MDVVVGFLTLFSVLVPAKQWYAPSQPITITVKSDQAVTLELVGAPLEGVDNRPTSPRGLVFPTTGSPDVAANQTVDLKTIFPDLNAPGAFVLFALPKGTPPTKTGWPPKFLGTPMVILDLPPRDQQVAHNVDVVHVEPLCYAVMTTDAAPTPMTIVFYYDVAPHTVDNFLNLAAGGYYDGLAFHRIIAKFMVQGGDPMGTGEGGPGYHVDAEFNDRPHFPGVLSMARQGDPQEDPKNGIPPRPQYANSAGSQFFICLDYTNTQHLDGHYTDFGRVVQGMDTLEKLGATPVGADGQTPVTAPKIVSVVVKPVTADNDPYEESARAATQP